MGDVFHALVWREGEWFVAQAQEVDIASQGKDVNEAIDNLREALELHFEPLPDAAGVMMFREYSYGFAVGVGGLELCEQELAPPESQLFEVEIAAATP